MTIERKEIRAAPNGADLTCGADNLAMIEIDLRCVGCDYNLRGLPPPGRCPECGETVDATIRRQILSTAPRSQSIIVLSAAELLNSSAWIFLTACLLGPCVVINIGFFVCSMVLALTSIAMYIAASSRLLRLNIPNRSRQAHRLFRGALISIPAGIAAACIFDPVSLLIPLAAIIVLQFMAIHAIRTVAKIIPAPSLIEHLKQFRIGLIVLWSAIGVQCGLVCLSAFGALPGGIRVSAFWPWGFGALVTPFFVPLMTILWISITGEFRNAVQAVVSPDVAEDSAAPPRTPEAAE